MTKIFTTHRGLNVQFADEFQTLTGPIFKTVCWHECAETWFLMDAWDVSYTTLAEAVASRAWLELDDREDIQGYLDDHADGLPYAILELHPEDGARLHSIMWTSDDRVEAWDWGCNAITYAHREGLMVSAQ